MKKIVSMLVVLAVGGAMAATRHHRRAAAADVNAVIDARLHELLVKLNAQHR
jgi:hypothetical protein